MAGAAEWCSGGQGGGFTCQTASCGGEFRDACCDSGTVLSRVLWNACCENNRKNVNSTNPMPDGDGF